jgi:hypothetical protein
MPDIVIANLYGVRVVIEGKIGDGGVIQDILAKQAKKRVEDGIAPLCIAVLYPNSLRTFASLEELKINMEKTRFSVATFWSDDHTDWTNHTVDGLTDILRRSYGLLVSEDTVVEAVNEIQEAVESCAEAMTSVPTVPYRISVLLGIPPERLDEAEGVIKTSRIAALALINACIFHQVVAEGDSRIHMLGRITSEGFVAEALASDWEKILKEIDYKPIFNLANEIIKELRGLSQLDQELSNLCKVALHITTRRAALKQDLMGRIYHRLLADAKYFGAFYTSVSAATLLSSLAFESLRDTIDWSDLTSVEKFKIADLACGTGTLLKAVFHEVEDNYVHSTAQKKKIINLESFHRCILQECMWGFDVVPFAIHLSASALAIHNPKVLFENLRLYTLKLGLIQNKIQLGSLDFLTGRRIGVQADSFGAPSAPGRITGEGELSESVEIPLLDLCIMNPPFTRSVGGNLLFGNAPASERKRMQTHLKRIVRKELGPAGTHRINANITAGLASVFVALAVDLTKPGGILALVLPRALLTGVAWEVTRDLIASNFYIRDIVVSHEPGQWSFSESTNLSECLIVAERIRSGQTRKPTKFVNLWTKPKNNIEALAIANEVKRLTGASLEDSHGTQELLLENTKFGEIITRPIHNKDISEWGIGVAFAQTELCRVVYNLLQGKLYLPGMGKIGDVPLITLGELGELGPDVRDIWDGFTRSETYTTYQAVWGHSTESIRCIAQEPNIYLTPLSEAVPGRLLRDPIDLWAKSGRLLLAERLRLTTVRVVGIFISTSALSTSWWPFSAHKTNLTTATEIEQILSTWINSTLGILLMIASRVETEGSWIKLKKPNLSSMLVLNPDMIEPDLKKNLTKAFNDFSKVELQRLPDMMSDNARAVIDTSILDALGISGDIGILRKMLSLEPSISGRLPD